MIEQPERPPTDGTDGMTRPEAVHSPCTGLCDLDVTTQLCRGCYRTLDEIVHWSGMSSRQREGVLRSATLRRSGR